MSQAHRREQRVFLHHSTSASLSGCLPSPASSGDPPVVLQEDETEQVCSNPECPPGLHISQWGTSRTGHSHGKLKQTKATNCRVLIQQSVAYNKYCPRYPHASDTRSPTRFSQCPPQGTQVRARARQRGGPDELLSTRTANRAETTLNNPSLACWRRLIRKWLGLCSEE